MSDEVQAIAEEMKSEESFDLLAAVQDVAYPVGETTVYLNGKLAGEYNDLKGDLELVKAEDAQALVNAEAVEIQEKLDALLTEIRKTALTFHMRGVAPAVKKAISAKARTKFKVPKNADESEKQEIWIKENAWITNELIRHSIVKVVNSKGQVDSRGFENEQIQQLADHLIESEFGKLDTLCARLSSASHLFSESLDADFLPKPSADQ